MNEAIIENLKNNLGYLASDVKINYANKPENLDLQEEFINWRINELEFLIQVKDFQFSQARLIFMREARPDQMGMAVVAGVEFGRDYPTRIGYINDYRSYVIDALMIPLDAIPQKVPTKSAISERADTTEPKGVDFLSNFLNKHFKFRNNLENDFWWPNDFIPIEIKPLEGRKGWSLIILKNTFHINYREPNFFPAMGEFSKCFELIDKFIIKIREFFSNFALEDYPHNPYFNGPEAFLCKKCYSLTFPKKIGFAFRYEGLNKSTWESFLIEANCPNCKQKHKVWGLQDDEDMKKTIGELAWICPNDFQPYEIISIKQKKNLLEYNLKCSTCNGSDKREVREFYDPWLKTYQGKPNLNLEKGEGKNFIKYNFK